MFSLRGVGELESHRTRTVQKVSFSRRKQRNRIQCGPRNGFT
jgi:hypothetical protein